MPKSHPLRIPTRQGPWQTTVFVSFRSHSEASLSLDLMGDVSGMIGIPEGVWSALFHIVTDGSAGDQARIIVSSTLNIGPSQVHLGTHYLVADTVEGHVNAELLYTGSELLAVEMIG